MKFLYALGLCISSYIYYNRNKKRINKLLLLHSTSKLAKIFKLITEHFLENFAQENFFNGHVQTFLLEIIDFVLKFFRQFLQIFRFKYDRYIFTLSDGGKIPIDITNKKKNEYFYDIYDVYEHKKILIIIPGYTTNSCDYYVKNFVEDFVDDFEVHVMNVRGFGMKLYTPLMPSTHCYKDVREYLEYVCNKNQDKKVYAVGFSYGGMLLARCLGNNSGSIPDNLVGSCGICYPLSLESTRKHVEIQLGGFYSKYGARSLKKCFNDNLDIIFDKNENMNIILGDKITLIEKVSKIQHVAEFDDIYTHRVLGFENVDDYYNDSKIDSYLEKIKIPFLSVFTEDDPIIPCDAIPVKIYQSNKNLVTIISKNGGHMGFFTGGNLKRWIGIPIKTFFKTIEILNEVDESL